MRSARYPSVLEHEYGVEDVKDYTLPPSLWDGITRAIGVHVMQSLEQSVSTSVLAMLPRSTQLTVK